MKNLIKNLLSGAAMTYFSISSAGFKKTEKEKAEEQKKIDDEFRCLGLREGLSDMVLSVDNQSSFSAVDIDAVLAHEVPHIGTEELHAHATGTDNTFGKKSSDSHEFKNRFHRDPFEKMEDGDVVSDFSYIGNSRFKHARNITPGAKVEETEKPNMKEAFKDLNKKVENDLGVETLGNTVATISGSGEEVVAEVESAGMLHISTFMEVKKVN